MRRCCHLSSSQKRKTVSIALFRFAPITPTPWPTWAWRRRPWATTRRRKIASAKPSVANPGTPTPRSRLVGLLQRRGHAEEARQLLESALVAARSPQVHLALGNVLLAAGETENAAQHYRAAMQTCITPRAKGPLIASDRLVYDGIASRDILHVGHAADALEASETGGHQTVGSGLRAAAEVLERRGVRSLQDQGVEPLRKVAFVSPHCLLDFTNGAATSTLDGLKLLRNLGFACEAFCGSRRDAPDESRFEDVLARCGERYAVRDAQIGGFQARMGFATIDARHGETPVTLVDTGSALGRSANTEGIAAFLAACELFLARFRPDVVWTYGGDPLSLAVQHIAKQQGIPILFAVHNSTYTDRAVFGMADRVVVPAEFSRTYYRQALGLTCDVLPSVVNWEAAEVSDRRGRYLTFINPEGIKGVFVFARIARELARRRPDIPILVAQGRSRFGALGDPALGLAAHLCGQFPVEPACDGRNIATMPFVPVPRAFYPAVYSRTKLLLMPSLCNETFGLVAAEAMLNGIPVLASDRGALPETIGNAGFLFEIPAKYTPKTREVPTAEEVEPWVETIIRLWDDAAEYERRSKACAGAGTTLAPGPNKRPFIASSSVALAVRTICGQQGAKPVSPLLALEVGLGAEIERLEARHVEVAPPCAAS